jgi:hypothetical protein
MNLGQRNLAGQTEKPSERKRNLSGCDLQAETLAAPENTHPGY